MSGDSTPVTAADFAIQGLVSKALKQQCLDDIEAIVWRVWKDAWSYCRRVKRICTIIGQFNMFRMRIQDGWTILNKICIKTQGLVGFLQDASSTFIISSFFETGGRCIFHLKPGEVSSRSLHGWGGILGQFGSQSTWEFLWKIAKKVFDSNNI